MESSITRVDLNKERISYPIFCNHGESTANCSFAANKKCRYTHNLFPLQEIHWAIGQLALHWERDAIQYSAIGPDDRNGHPMIVHGLGTAARMLIGIWGQF